MKQQTPGRRGDDDVAIRPAIAGVAHEAAVAIGGLHHDAVRRPTKVDERARRPRLGADWTRSRAAVAANSADVSRNWRREVTSQGMPRACRERARRRTFEVYALDTKLDVSPSSATPAVNAALETRANVMKAMQGHVLGKAVYVGLFHRPQ